jgi:hypothetical protein
MAAQRNTNQMRAYLDDCRSRRPDLTSVGQWLIVGPIHDAWRSGVGRNVAHTTAGAESVAGGCEEGINGRMRF